MVQHYARTPALYVRSRPHRYFYWLAGVITLLIVGVAAGAAGATLFGSHLATTKATNPANDLRAFRDVTLTKCAVDPGTGWPQATMTVTNHGTANASYLLTIAFQSKDGSTQYQSAQGTVQALAPGQKAAAMAEGLAPAPRAFACAVASVTRE